MPSLSDRERSREDGSESASEVASARPGKARGPGTQRPWGGVLPLQGHEALEPETGAFMRSQNLGEEETNEIGNQTFE